MAYNTSYETATKKHLLNRVMNKEYLYLYLENDILKLAFDDYLVMIDLQLKLMYRYGNNVRENYLLSNLENKKIKCIFSV